MKTPKSSLCYSSFFTSVITSFLFQLVWLPLCSAQQMLFPAEVPLAVRSTYFSAWESTMNGSVYSSNWPTTPLAPNGILGWAGLVRIDGVTYKWLGAPTVANGTTVKNLAVTPTRTTFVLEAGPMELTVQFLSPIEPGDFVKQSTSFSYVSFEAQSLDGIAHAVQVYSDISGEWTSGDRAKNVKWGTDTTSGIFHHTIQLDQNEVFVDNAGQAQWGTTHYAALQGPSTTFKTGADTDVRGQFQTNGILDGVQDTAFRAINNRFVVLAISEDLGTIAKTAKPVVWAVGQTRSPAVQYINLDGSTQSRSLYSTSNFSSDAELVSSFLSDFNTASDRASALDQRLTTTSVNSNLSSDYIDILSLVIRQVYGSTELTIGTGSDGKANASDVMMFMRDNGAASLRVQPVEILFAAFPMFMVVDPSLGAPLLEPLLRAQNSKSYTLPFAASDLGSSYPSVTATAIPHRQGVEQSGNMIIMAYAHARATGDGALLGRYYTLLRGWADYLVANTLALPNQISSDDLSTVNQTNLAFKGIVAIQAMAGISQALGVADDANQYSSQALSLYLQWKALALSTSDQHLLESYDQQQSWSLGYNLFVDKWLGTNLVDTEIFTAQANVLTSVFTSSPGTTKFGLPLSSGNTTAVTASVNMLAAAMINGTASQRSIISAIHNRASLNTSAGAFPLVYDRTTGDTSLGIASPALGAALGILALNVPVQDIRAPNFSLPAKSRSSGEADAGTIAGGVVGGLAGIALAAGLVFLFQRHRRTQMRRTGKGNFDIEPATLESPSWPESLKNYTSVWVDSLPRGADLPGAGQMHAIVPSVTSQPRSLEFSPTSVASRSPPQSERAAWTANYPGRDTMRQNALLANAFSARSSSSDQIESRPAPPVSTKELMRRRIAQENAVLYGSVHSFAHTLSLAGPESTRSGETRESSADMYALQLREEVANLRQEVQRIRMETFEPPPIYEQG